MLVIALMPVPGVVQAEEHEKILIRNVRLIDRDGKAEDQNVNILIKKTKLYMVTRDKIELEDGMIGYDAQNGVVIGNLDIGKPANFLIVDQDPREDIEVLLDTKTHMLFAIHHGNIVRNTLPQVGVPEPASEEKKKTRWIGYTPPPMALPVSYQDTTKWNRWEPRYISGIFIAAVALDRQRWLTQDETSKEQVGDLKEYEGGEIRAFRLGVTGTLNFKKPWFYQFIVATHAFDRGYDAKTTDDVTLLDYRLDIPLPRQLTLSVGKQKEPISLERLLMGPQLQMQERAAVLDALFQVRNVGITISGNGLDQRVSWAAGVFNDWFDTSQNFDESANQVTGRATGLPYISEDESHLLHLGFGVRYTDAREGLRYGARPEFSQSSVFVDTGILEAEKAFTYDLEVSWRRGPYWIAAEFVRNDVDAPQLGNPVFSGYHVTGSWILTREMRPYNRRNGLFGPVPVSRSVRQGGFGAWEVTARYSNLDLSDGLVDGGEMDIISLGFNWSLTPTSIFNINGRYIELDRFGVRGSSSGILIRLVLILE